MNTKEEFVTWLKSLPENTEFCESSRISSCPIAKFTGDLALPFSSQKMTWKEEFIMKYDKYYGKDLKIALMVAEMLWPNFFRC